MSTKPYAVTVDHAPLEQEDIRRAAEEMDSELRRLFKAPHYVDDHGLAHAWVRIRAAIWQAGSKAGGGR